MVISDVNICSYVLSLSDIISKCNKNQLKNVLVILFLEQPYGLTDTFTDTFQ